MKSRTDRALSDKTLPGNVAVRPARPNVSINVFDDCPAGPWAPSTKKAAFPAARNKVTAATTSRRQAAAVVFVRENHLYPHGGPAVSNLLTETSQLSSAIERFRPFRGSLPSSFSLFPFSLFSFSRPSFAISSYLSAEPALCNTRLSCVVPHGTFE